MLALSHAKELLKVRQWDQLLKFSSNFNSFKLEGLNSARICFNLKSAEDEISVIKGLDFFRRLFPSVNFRVKLLHKTKRYNSSSPIQVFSFLRGYELYNFFFYFNKILNLVFQRHTFFSKGFAAKSVTFNVGNIGEVFSSLNPSYDYYKWLTVLSAVFFTSGFILLDRYYFSVFSIFF
jgi:hypothetical protein